MATLTAGSESGPLSPQMLSTTNALKGSSSLSTKVTAVLSTSYADAEFRDALALLDEHGAHNNPETRRQLRLNLQKDVIDSNGTIIGEFSRVADQLHKIGNTLDRLNQSYKDMKAQVSAAHVVTNSVLGDATSLMHERRRVEVKQQLLESLQGHFVLSDDEVSSLTLTSEPVDDRFFLALGKAKRISKDCELLLGIGNQTLGHEVMEHTTRTVNQAFQKLYRWIQREFKSLNLENPQIGSTIRRALRVLAERPTLIQNCLDFFAEAREHVLSDAFIMALTGTSDSGIGHNTGVKPIELTAHDSLRYVGDMLAWIHSAAVSEREALEVLFVADGGELANDIQAGRERQVWRLIADDDEETTAFDAVRALNDLVDRNVSGSTRVFRQRVEQVIQSSEDTILAYKLVNLLGFYRVTFTKLLGNASLLVELLASVESEALRQFRSLMKDHIAALQGELQHEVLDLAPPDFLHEALKQLEAIMQTYGTSLASSEDREAEFQPVLAVAMDPFVQACETLAQGIAAPNGAVFLANCLTTIQPLLAKFDFTAGRVAQMQSQVDDISHDLADYQYSFFCQESGLSSLFAALAPLTDSRKDIEKAECLGPLQPHALAQASQQLDDFLPSALMDAMENVKRLQDSKLARRITEEAAEKFCVEFEHVEDMLIFADELVEQKGGGEDGERQMLRMIFPRTTGEIRVLLS